MTTIIEEIPPNTQMMSLCTAGTILMFTLNLMLSLSLAGKMAL